MTTFFSYQYLFRKFIDSLPDKGEKIKNFCAQIEEELNKCRIHEALCKDMSLLKIGKDQLDSLEWTGKHIPYNTTKNKSQSNVDDDENVLKIFISHSGVNVDKIIIKYAFFFSISVENKFVLIRVFQRET